MKQILTFMTAAILLFSCSKEAVTESVIKHTVLQVFTNVPSATVALFTSKDARQKYVFDNDGAPVYSITSDLTGKATFTDINAGYYYWYSYYGCQNSVNNPLPSNGGVIANDTTKVTDVLDGVGTLKVQNTNLSISIDVYLNDVFKINVPAGYSVTFKNQPSNTPIIVKAVNKTFNNSQTKYPEISSCGGTQTVQFNP